MLPAEASALVLKDVGERGVVEALGSALETILSTLSSSVAAGLISAAEGAGRLDADWDELACAEPRPLGLSCTIRGTAGAVVGLPTLVPVLGADFEEKSPS